MPPTPPPFSGDFSIQSSQDARTSGVARVAPRSESASRFQFIATYFGDMGCASRTHQPAGLRRAGVSAAHPALTAGAVASLSTAGVFLFPGQAVHKRLSANGCLRSSNQSMVFSPDQDSSDKY